MVIQATQLSKVTEIIAVAMNTAHVHTFNFMSLNSYLHKLFTRAGKKV